MLRALWQKFDRDWGWNLARLLAYSFLMALFAITGLELILLSLVLRVADAHAQQSISYQILRLLPDRITSGAALTFIHGVQHAPWPVLILGLPVTLWYGTRFFVVLESCLCIVFRRPRRSFRRQNRAALGMLALFAALLNIIAFSVALSPYVLGAPARISGSALSAARLGSDPLIALLALLAGIGANVLLLLVAYTELTPGGLSVRAALPGALLAALLAYGYLLIFPFYVRDVVHPGQFGTYAGIVLVALVFFFAYSVLILIGAEVAALREGYRATTHEITVLLSDLETARSRPPTTQIVPAESAGETAGEIAPRALPDVFSQPWHSPRLAEPGDAG